MAGGEVDGGVSAQQSYLGLSERLLSTDLRVQHRASSDLRATVRDIMQPMSAPPNQKPDSQAAALREQKIQKLVAVDMLKSVSLALARTVQSIASKEPVSVAILTNILDALCNLLKRSHQFQFRYGQLPDGIPALVQLLKFTSEDVRGYCARAIWCVCLDFPIAQERLASCGGLQALNDLLPAKVSNNWVVEQVCGAIGAACRENKGNQQRFRSMGTLEALLSVLHTDQAPERLLYCAYGALSSLCWNNTENQNVLRTIASGAFLFTIKKSLSSKLTEPLKSHKNSMDQYIFAQIAELISAFCYRNAACRQAFREAGLCPYLVLMLKSDMTAVRAQAAGAIYSCCVDDLAMQIEIGVTLGGIVEVSKLMGAAGELVDKFYALVALGALLRRCPNTQAAVIELHNTGNHQADIRPGLQKLMNYLNLYLEKEQAKLPCVLEALYNSCIDSKVKYLITFQSTYVVLFLQKVMASKAVKSPTKILAADALRVAVMENVHLPQQISPDEFVQLCKVVASQPTDVPEMNFAMCSVVAAIALSIPSHSEAYITALANSDLSPDIWGKILQLASSKP